MAFNKFGKYIFPIVATIFTADVLIPSISPLQAIPVFQNEIECDDYVVEETVRRFINEGVRQHNVQANKLAQFFVGHATDGLDRSNPLWDTFARGFEGAGRMAENATKPQDFISFASFESKEISDDNGIKQCRVIANTVYNTMSGKSEIQTHNFIVSISENQIIVD
jgi:hypothetical protein